MPSNDARRLLLDTHVWLWHLSAPQRISSKMTRQIEHAALDGEVYVQAFSVWELAMLEAKGRIGFDEPLSAWVQRAVAMPGFELVPLEPEIAIASTRLPGTIHADPADRILAATARVLGLTLVTRDAALLAYARQGHIRAIAA